MSGAGAVAPDPDVYVRTGFYTAIGRVEEIADQVRIEYGWDQHGKEQVIGVEVLSASSVEANGEDIRRDATTATAAADAVTEIATDRARVREQRDRALDLAEAALGAKGVYDRPRLLDELARLRRVVAGVSLSNGHQDTGGEQ